jgi:H+/gluconate symporter-like permease
VEEVETKKEVDILGLVDWLDGKQKDRKNPLMRSWIVELFSGEIRGAVIAYLIGFFVIWFGAYEYGVTLALKGSFTFDSLLVVLTALVSAAGVLLAGMTFIQPYLHENETYVRYKRALDFRKRDSEENNGKGKISAFTEEEKPLLKALIILMATMRYEYNDFSLRTLYDLDKNKVMFSRDKLLERLCSREQYH